MKVGLLQLNATVGDFSANLRQIRAGYERACAGGAEIVLAPEMALLGYPPRDLLLRSGFIDANLNALSDLAAAVGDIPLCVGYVERNSKRPGKALRNAAAFLHRGRVEHVRFKSLLPTYDVFDEDRYFEPASENRPIEFAGRKLGLTICEDIWNDADFWPERLYRCDPVHDLVASGADLILNISASPWHRGKEKTRLAMLRKVARDEKVALVQVNAVGANDELIFDGHTVALNRRGELLAHGAAFSDDLLVVDVDTAPAIAEAWAPEEELLAGALQVGIRDYVRKTGFRQALVGLSGGIDSALVAVLAARALGPENVTGVSMPSRYSSSGSLSDAERLARNLKIRYEVIPIAEPVASLEKELGPLFTGRSPDTTEENIQSRLRGVLLMALSNKFGSLVLTTGNKSEMAVGYCTLYGDMCGALAVIADIFKTEVYQLARWINRESEIIPAASLEKPPSAELRPDQFDQESLPPYDILDDILRLHLLDELGAAEIVARGFEESVVKDVLNKVNFSEYKRRQAAPGLKVSPRAFGAGRRVPIAQRYRS